MPDPAPAEQERCGVVISPSSGVAQVVVSCRLLLGHDGEHEGKDPTIPAEQERARAKACAYLDVCKGKRGHRSACDSVTRFLATALDEQRERSVRAIIAADIGGFCGCRQDGEATCPTHLAMVAAIRRDDA